MNFLNLEYFLVVAKELNITKAASILNLSQQSLSKHILNLEKDVDMPLFDRGARLTLTEAGTCFLINVTKILDMKAQMLTQMQDIKDYKNNNIRIGITLARSSIYLPFFLPKFQSLFPEAQIHLIEKPSEDLFDDLLEGKIDVIVGIEPQNKLDFSSYPLCIEDYAIMVPKKILHAYFTKEEIKVLNTRQKAVPIVFFKDCPFLSFDCTKRIGRIFKEICTEAGFEPNITLESASISTLINLCVRGLGIIICPTIFIELSRMQADIFDSVNVYPIPDSPMQTNIAITLPQNRYASKLTREFIRIIKEEFSKSKNRTFTEHFIEHQYETSQKKISQ